jgi:hypothetical protein
MFAKDRRLSIGENKIAKLAAEDRDQGPGEDCLAAKSVAKFGWQVRALAR